MKSGVYYLSAQAQDQRGAKSPPADSQRIEVSLSGLSLGSFLISFQTLILFLLTILLLGVMAAGYFFYRTARIKRQLLKETREVKESVHQAFQALDEEIEEKIQTVDSQPGFSPQEKKIYSGLKETLKIAEEFINKEIADVEKELK